jgi:dUTP pyrophosphatase
MKLGIKKMYGGVDLPKFGTEGAAAFDLAYQPGERQHYGVYSPTNSPMKKNILPTGSLLINPGERCQVPTSLIFDIPEGYHLKVYSRSSTGLIKGLQLCNSVGIIDSDYTGELFLTFMNISNIGVKIELKDRLAQAMLVKNEKYDIVEVSDVSEKKSSRKAGDAGGLGSTGDK